MRIHLFPRRRMVVVALLALAVGCGVYAYAAANTVPASNAGSGSGTISGYTVSSIAYTLNSTTPTNLDQVAFTIAPTTGTVKVQLASGGSWYSCTNSAGSVTCSTTSPQATAAAATQLTVVAAQ